MAQCVRSAYAVGAPCACAACVLHRHRRQLRHEAAALEPQPCRGGVGGRLGRVGDGPAASHAEVHMHNHVRRLARGAREEREEVLAYRLATAERATFDEFRALREAALRRGRAVSAADEAARVLRCDPMHGVALDHVCSRPELLAISRKGGIDRTSCFSAETSRWLSRWLCDSKVHRVEIQRRSERIQRITAADLLQRSPSFASRPNAPRATLCTTMSTSATALNTKQKVGLDMLSEAREGDFGAAFSVLVKVLGNLATNPEEGKYRKLRTTNAKIQALLATSGVRALLVGSGFVEEPDALNAESADVSTVQAGLEGLQNLQASRAVQEAAQKAAMVQERNAQVTAARALPSPARPYTQQRPHPPHPPAHPPTSLRPWRQHKDNRENRETMLKRLADDATMRKEPGWKAQATACKDAAAPHAPRLPHRVPGGSMCIRAAAPCLQAAALLCVQAAGCKDSSKSITSAADIGAQGGGSGGTLRCANQAQA